MKKEIKIVSLCLLLSIGASFVILKRSNTIEKFKEDPKFRQNFLRYSYAYRDHSTGACLTTFCKNMNTKDKPEKVMAQIDESLTKSAYCLWGYAIKNNLEDKPVNEIKDKINCDN